MDEITMCWFSAIIYTECTIVHSAVGFNNWLICCLALLIQSLIIVSDKLYLCIKMCKFWQNNTLSTGKCLSCAVLLIFVFYNTFSNKTKMNRPKPNIYNFWLPVPFVHNKNYHDLICSNNYNAYPYKVIYFLRIAHEIHIFEIVLFHFLCDLLEIIMVQLKRCKKSRAPPV